MSQNIAPGALVECADYPLGPVERVEEDGALVVRPARASYLLRVPADLIAVATPGWVRLRASLQEVEQYVLAGEAGEPAPAHVTTQAGDAGPYEDEVLGRPPGEPPTFPPTG